MHQSQERALNQAAYRQQRDFIRENYPRGRFVGISGGKIIADAGSFQELDALLDRLGFGSPDVLVVEAGVDYPERATIFRLGQQDL
ncbi:MAG TPA: hypothetical protein VFI31_18990 [Pirellulales bacterium]|nr:hypothetical protein [Pirellulales bacterium]